MLGALLPVAGIHLCSFQHRLFQLNLVQHEQQSRAHYRWAGRHDLTTMPLLTHAKAARLAISQILGNGQMPGRGCPGPTRS
jgi:hypothetical protein